MPFRACAGQPIINALSSGLRGPQKRTGHGPSGGSGARRGARGNITGDVGVRTLGLA